jgi:hypothetical protein
MLTPAKNLGVFFYEGAQKFVNAEVGKMPFNRGVFVISDINKFQNPQRLAEITGLRFPIEEPDKRV